MYVSSAIRTWRSSCRSQCRSVGRTCGCHWSLTGTACWQEETRTTCLSRLAPAARPAQFAARRGDRRYTRNALKVRSCMTRDLDYLAYLDGIDCTNHCGKMLMVISWHSEFSLHWFPEESSVEGSWMLRNDTLQTPGPLQTPQLTSTVLRENRPAEHMPDPDSEPGSENDYVHKSVHSSSLCLRMHTEIIYLDMWIIVVGQPCWKSRYQNWYKSGVSLPRHLSTVLRCRCRG